METIIFVLLGIWSANICNIHNLCDLGGAGKKTKSTGDSWTLS